MAVVVALTGCTSNDSEQRAPSSAPPTTFSGSPSPSPGADADAALLPIPVKDIRTWAETAVMAQPNGDDPRVLSGWLSENTSAHHVTTYTTIDPGMFQGQIACRGGGVLTLSWSEMDAEPSADPVVCSDETIAFDITTTRPGMTLTLDLEGSPTIYAISTSRLS